MEPGMRVPTVGSDTILASLFGVCMGICAAGIANAFLPAYLSSRVVAEATFQTGIIWTGFGGALAYGWLCAEHNQRLKRVLPWFLENKEKWAMGKELAGETGNVTLTIDTRNEFDGFTSRYFGPLPVKVERFSLWATAAIEGNSLAINKWTGKGKEFDRYTEYQPLIKMMLNAGVLVKSGKGNVLTHTGKRTLRQHLKAHPPTPFQGCA